MRVVQLGEHAKLIRGITFKPKDKCNPQDDGAVVCMRTKNVQTTLDESDLIAIPSKLVKNPEKIISIGDILVSSANSWNLVGKCCQVLELQFPSTAGGFISILRPKTEQLYSGYLYRWFSSDVTQSRLRSFGNQTTNISNLDHKRTLKLEIPLPPLAEQKRIATILDAADALRAKRRESLAQLESLLQSTFLDMFGDPVTNPMGWDLKPLGELGSLDRGVSKHRPRNDPLLLGGNHPLIQTGDVANSGGYIRHFISTYSDIGLKQSKLWPAGTLCITIAANIANTGILMFDSCFPDSVVGFLSNEEGRVEYVQGLFGFFRKILEHKAPQSAQKNINLKILRELLVPVPSFEFQRRFAAIAKSVERQKTQQGKHLTELDALFASLQQRAFKGDL